MYTSWAENALQSQKWQLIGITDAENFLCFVKGSDNTAAAAQAKSIEIRVLFGCTSESYCLVQQTTPTILVLSKQVMLCMRGRRGRQG